MCFLDKIPHTNDCAFQGGFSAKYSKKKDQLLSRNEKVLLKERKTLLPVVLISELVKCPSSVR